MRLLVYPLIALLSACASHTGVPPQADAIDLPETDYQLIRSVRYSPDDWPENLSADIYRPKGKGPFPAVLVVHGGGAAVGLAQPACFRRRQPGSGMI